MSEVADIATQVANRLHRNPYLVALVEAEHIFSSSSITGLTGATVTLDNGNTATYERVAVGVFQ